jgi:phage terminase large subunit-like protein
MHSTLHLMPSERLEALEATLAAEKEKRRLTNKLAHFVPYPKQLEHYAAGAIHRERLLMAANQVGKSECGAIETACHLTGLYPEWWPGRRYDRPVKWWAGSDTTETTRDTVQTKLIGPPADENAWGTGAIPAKCIIDRARRQGVANALDTVLVRHVSGGVSELGFKSYDQGRQKWQGAVRDGVWLDEEPPQDIYTEAMTRTNTIEDGMIYLTFTPLLGMSEVVLSFLGDM